MGDRYQVKFMSLGGFVYGTVDSYSDDAKKLKGSGTAIVTDTVFPKRYKVPEANLIDIPLSTNYGEGEIDKYREAEFEKAQKLSDSIDKFAPGKLFSVGVADGMAFYVVTKVGKKNVTVEWRGFQGDGYTAELLGWGGQFPRSSIEPLVRRADGLRAIFGRKK